MKKLLVAAVLLASSSVFALEYTNAVRGSTMIVEVGHSQGRRWKLWVIQIHHITT